ncbi:MAG: signal peptide peptidase SppA, partial [Myxococcota bacterium]|nr:signal peptide peptidase SppA [Myxococcota bacterium]
MWRLALLLLLPLGLTAARAQGVPPGLEETPTRGLYHPGAGIADGAEPFAVGLNPASLGELRGLSVGLRHTELAGTPPLAPGLRGTGVYAATPLPYLERVQVGAAVEVLRPADGLLGRLALALSVRPLSFLSLGLTYTHLPGGPDHPFAGLNSLALGLRLRLDAWLSLGFLAYDINAPGRPLDGTPLQRVYEAEVLARPLGDDRLELGAGARVGERRADVAPRLRLWLRPRRGLGLGAEASMLVEGERQDFRAAAGLSLDWGPAGGSLMGVLGGTMGGQVTSGGGSLGVRASMERYPSLPLASRAARLLRLELGHLKGVAFLQLLERLRGLERDQEHAGVVVVLGDLSVGWARAEELREALWRLRRAGRRVFAYGATLSTRAYHVATAAERIYLDPAGNVRLLGVASGSWNVKEALDWIGVRADLVRVGEYKSAPETFTRSEPSEPARQQREQLVAALHERLIGAMMQGRRLSHERATALIDRALFSPPEAKEAGLVDAVLPDEQVERDIERALRRRVHITLPSSHPVRFRSWAPRAIAVITIEGDLAEGSSRTVPILEMKFAGSETILGAIEEAERDPGVAAVVLRIESPGGSSLVADLLARRIVDLAKRKPVVCSLGDVAASGGYYVAAPCHRIFTSATTITGSIGIFGGKVDLSQLLARLGLRHTAYLRGAHADMEQPYRPYTDEERALLQAQIRHAYERFLEVVARGRGLQRHQVDALGRGRVWVGSAAVAHRLCDEEGGLMDAVAAAQDLAGMPAGAEVELRCLPRQERGLLQRLLRLLGLPPLELPGVLRLSGAVSGLPAA